MSVALAHLSLPKVGEDACGDAVVMRCEGDWSLFAVIDGLGHGPKAEVVAKMSVDFLSGLAPGESARTAMLGLHQALRGSRGAAATLMILSGQRFEGCGVGNVELRCLDARLPILLSPGVLGARVENFRFFQGELPPRARLVCFSDGISRRAPFEDMRGLAPDAFCKAVMDGYRLPVDDSTVLVCDLEA